MKVKPVRLTTSLKKIKQEKNVEVSSLFVILTRNLGPEWGDEEEISIFKILDLNGPEDAVWALRVADQSDQVDRIARLIAVDCAMAMLPAWEQINSQLQLRAAIEVAKQFAMGLASIERLVEAEKEIAGIASEYNRALSDGEMYSPNAAVRDARKAANLAAQAACATTWENSCNGAAYAASLAEDSKVDVDYIIRHYLAE